jgi:peroxiredoxin
MATGIRGRLSIALPLLFALTAGLVQAGAPAQPKFVEDSEDGSLEGQKAPDFTLTTLDGKKVQLSRLKGKVVLLDFWASWCGPCRRSMPHLQETYSQYKDKGLVVVGINVDKEQGKAKEFLSGLTVAYPLALDPTSKVLGSYQVMQMPTAFLIDKKGVIRHKIVGFSDNIAKTTSAQIEELLK